MTVYDKLMRILEHTSSDLLDDMWPGAVSLDLIVEDLMMQHGEELGVFPNG